MHFYGSWTWLFSITGLQNMLHISSESLRSSNNLATSGRLTVLIGTMSRSVEPEMLSLPSPVIA